MTPEELVQVKLAIENLRTQGFFESSIDELLGLAVKRQMLMGESYVESLRFTIQDELPKYEMAIVHDEDHVELLHKTVN